jgi:hypothetical protein
MGVGVRVSSGNGNGNGNGNGDGHRYDILISGLLMRLDFCMLPLSMPWVVFSFQWRQLGRGAWYVPTIG